jgi:hypothetical protein
VAGALAGLSVHIKHSGLLLVGAAAFALLAVTARGPLGLARVCGPRLHATLDIVVAVALAAAPLLPALRPDITGIAVVEVTALAWIRLATLTRYTRTAAAPESELARDEATPAPPGSALLRGLGMVAGRSARQLPEAEEKLRTGARQAGRHAARVQRAWRKPPS